ncbi:MAG: hypothetical protein RLZ98_2527 [Pseudomonadota bacterium]
MGDSGRETGRLDEGKGDFKELFQEGRALYTLLVIGGVAMHALQILVIAIVMPTVVADIGGAAFYTWTAMLYTIGAIIGASSTGPLWSRFGARCTYAIAAAVFAVGTVGCALAPDIGWLVAARGVQGWAGGLMTGSGFALVTSLYDARLRTRILAIAQATFTVAHLAGPVVGGYLAAIHWWRGSFWVVVPFMLAFAVIAWTRIPDTLARDDAGRSAAFPFFRLATLALGVCSVAAIGPVEATWLRALLLVMACVLVGTAFQLDRRAPNKLFPADVLSLSAPIGIAIWMLALHSMGQTSLMLFLPLLLQVVHGITPILISYATILLSVFWTIAAFAVSGLSGRQERLVMALGPVLVFFSLLAIAGVAQGDNLLWLTIFAAIFGFGVGSYNGHLVARTMGEASKEEQKTTAGALTSIRSLGTSFGAAIAGVIAHSAGLGTATDPVAVGQSVTLVFLASCIPVGLAALLMLRFLNAVHGAARDGGDDRRGGK